MAVRRRSRYTRRLAQEVDMAVQIHHVNIRTRDLEGTIAF
jgi:hypothetical protein